MAFVRSFLGLSMVVLSPSSVARAAEMPSDKPWRVVHRTSLGGRLNPGGLLLDGRLTWNHRIFHSAAPAWRDNHVAIGVIGGLAPSLWRAGILVELQPATFINIWASTEHIGYAGAFRQMTSLASATSPYGDRYLDALVKSTGQGPYATDGSRFQMGATLRLQAGGLLLRDNVRVVFASVRLREGDRVFYDLVNDLIVENGGWAAANELDLAWRGEAVTTGLRWGSACAFYSPAAFAPDDDRSQAPGWLHRLGPFAATQWRTGLDQPEWTLFGQLGWWLAHPSRSGPVPMIQIGASMTGDLL